MNIQHNYLRFHRKRSKLTQSDISFILGLPDYSSVSRWEQGRRNPSIEALIVYHLLFDAPIESFYERQKNEIARIVSPRITMRLNELRQETPNRKTNRRIEFLECVLKRLTTPSNHEHDTGTLS